MKNSNNLSNEELKTKGVVLKLYTPLREIYYVNSKGEISKNNINDINDFSPTWIFKGFKSVKSNCFIPFNDILKGVITDESMRYKNGNPKFTGRDLDHGTTREWGNTTKHGIHSFILL